MPFPHEIDEESYNKYHESVQVEYSKVGDKYFLQTTGLVPKSKVDEFRTNNITLKTENESLKSRVDVFGDMTENEFNALKTKAEKQGGEGLTDKEKEELVEAEVGKRIVKMKEENESVVLDLTTKLKTSDKQLSKVLIDTNLQNIGIKLGVKPEAVEDFITRGSTVFKMVEGAPTPMEGEDILFGKDGQTPLTMDDWAAGLSSVAPHLFKESTGSGDRHQQRHSSGAANQGAKGVGKMQASRRAS